MDLWNLNKFARRTGLIAGLAILVLGSSALRAITRSSAKLPGAAARAALVDVDELGDSMSIDAAGTLLAYTNEWGESALYVASLTDESPPRRLDVDVPFPCLLSLSPDGRWLAFASCYGPDHLSALYVHDLASGITRRVDEYAAGRTWWRQPPAWTPDGSKLVYVHFLPPQGKESEIRTLDPITGETTLVTSEPGRAVRAPSFSPDGTRMAYFAGLHLRVLDLATGAVKTIYGNSTHEPSPSIVAPDPAAWSPDGTRLAFGESTAEGYELWTADLASGETRVVSEPGTDSFRAAWTPAGDALVYLRSAHSQRTLWLHRMNGPGPDTPLGVAGGVTYRFGFDHEHRLIALTAPPDRPRALYRVSLDNGAPTLLYASPPFALPPRLVSLPEQDTVRSADGLEVPVVVFPRTCGDPHRPGPGLVIIHHEGATDVSPRWYSELQYAAASGMTVVGVNYRGSAGNGKPFVALRDDTEGRVDDLVAGIAYAKARPDIDPERVYVLLVSSSAPLAYAAIARAAPMIRGVIDWVGMVSPWTADAFDRPWPPMLWVSTRDDRVTADRERVAALLEKHGARIRHIVVDGDHGFHLREGRQQALEAIAEFVHQTSGYVCDPGE